MPGLTVTLPVANSTVSGPLTFSVDLGGLAGVHSIEYRLNEKPLYNNGDLVVPLTQPPFSLPWRTANVWDGYATILAVARDAAGHEIDTSPAVPFRIANGTVRLTMVAPNPAQMLSGTVNWAMQTDHVLQPTEKNLVWYFFLDGKERKIAFSPNAQCTISVDTTTLPNGRHELFCAQYIEMQSGTYPVVGMSQVMVNIDNGRVPMELRANFKDLHLIIGETATLNTRLIYTNGDEESVRASFGSSSNLVAKVNTNGLVTAIAPGFTTITLTARGRSTTTRVSVCPSRMFPHFSKDGRILSSFDAADSLFLRTMFNLNSNEINSNSNPNLGLLVQQAGINALTTGFYYNPGDNPANNDWISWKSGMDNLLNNIQIIAASNNLSIYLTGDDLARSNAELHDSVTNANSIPKIKHVFTWARNTNRVIGVDMVDEVNFAWGDTPTPADNRWVSRHPSIPDNAFVTLMGIINSVSNRPYLTWSVGGISPVADAQNWTGNSNFSDYNGIYWDVRSWRKAYPTGASLHQIIEGIDASVIGRQAAMLPDKPGILLTSAAGPLYSKGGMGDQFIAGQDKLLHPPVQPPQVAAEIVYAIIRGMAGVRTYAFDSAWAKLQRQQSLPNSGEELQTFTDPYKVGVERWKALSAAYNLIRDIEPYILQPNAHAIDLGPNIVTGAKAGAKGRLLLAINISEVSQTVTADLSPYITRLAIQRHCVIGSKTTKKTLAASTNSDTLVLEPGEIVAWVFRRPHTRPQPPGHLRVG